MILLVLHFNNSYSMPFAASVSPITKMILVSTVYYKKKWYYPFPHEHTKEKNFYLPDGTIHKMQMMTIKENFGYAEVPEIDGKVVHIPYEEFKQNLIIILPNRVDGIEDIEKSLDHIFFTKNIMNTINYVDLKITIPKFKVEGDYELKEVLEKLGIKTIFNGETSDFSKGTNQTGLEIGSIRHRTNVEVDEEGTEAAVASGAVLEVKIDAVRKFVPPFIADHPFLFAIIDTVTDTILFLGRFVG